MSSVPLTPLVPTALRAARGREVDYLMGRQKALIDRYGMRPDAANVPYLPEAEAKAMLYDAQFVRDVFVSNTGDGGTRLDDLRLLPISVVRPDLIKAHVAKMWSVLYALGDGWGGMSINAANLETAPTALAGKGVDRVVKAGPTSTFLLAAMALAVHVDAVLDGRPISPAGSAGVVVGSAVNKVTDAVKKTFPTPKWFSGIVPDLPWWVWPATLGVGGVWLYGTLRRRK